MIKRTVEHDLQARSKLRELFKGHPELIRAAIELQDQKERAEHEARENRFKEIKMPASFAPGRANTIF